MTRPLYAALFAAMLIVFQPIEANAYTSMGAGASVSCGKWLSEREKKDFFDMSNWATGFLSGAAWLSPLGADPLGKTDGEGVWYWFDNYCRTNPTVMFVDAVQAFYFAHTK
jgi:hypothetical protein